MKKKTGLVLAVLCVFALAGELGAATIEMSLNTMVGYGWKATTVDGPEAGASVTERVQDGSNGFQFSPKRSSNDNRSWAGISTGNFAGVKASQITTLRIRTYGLEGDGTVWQPPTFHLVFQRAPDNPSRREAIWLPWVNQPRLEGQWNEYDALTTGEWYIPWVGFRYATFADMLANYPDLVFVTDTQAETWGEPSGQSFNVASGALFNETNQYFSSARGTVDWFEVAIDGGEVTRYDLEPKELPTVILGTRGAYDTIMDIAKSQFKFVVFGSVTAVDVNDFTVDDGSGKEIKVVAPGHAVYPNALVRAEGVLNNTTTPPTLNSAVGTIVFLEF